MRPKKFNLVSSSDCWYGWPVQIAKELIKRGWEKAEDGISFCYLIDTGPKNPETGEEAKPENWPGLYLALEAIKKNPDLIFYSTEWFGDNYLPQNLSHKSFYLPFCCNTEIFKSSMDEPREIVGFVGNKSYSKRAEFIDYLSHNHNFKTVFPPFPVYFEELADFYSKCLIVPNQAQFQEIGSRLFEAAACGACVVQERVKGVEEMFIEDKEMIFWDNLHEMEEKIINLLNNPDKAKEIGRRAQIRVQRDHSLANRVNFIEQKLNEKL